MESIEALVKIPEPHSKEQLSFISCVAKRQVNKSGRRSGKTVADAIKALLAFCGICPKCIWGGITLQDGFVVPHVENCDYCKGTGKIPPRRELFLAPTAEQFGRFWTEVKRGLEGAIISGTLYKNEAENYIERVGTEQRIKAKTAWNAETAKGDYADDIFFDEWQIMNEDAWEEVGLPMLLDNNGTAVFTFTPPSLKSEGVSKAKDPRHASKMYRKAEKEYPRWETFHFTPYQNPTLSKEALAEISNEMSLDAYRREILAEDDEIEESWLVYSKFNENVCKIKRFTIPSNWSVYSGHDFGTANPAALFVAQVRLPLPEGAPNYLRYGDYVISKEYAPGAGFSTVQHIEKFREITKGYTVEMSLGGNVTTEEEIRTGYGAQGWPITAPLLTRVGAQLDRTIGLMETNKIYIFEDLYLLLSEISNCMWKLDELNKPTNEIRNEKKYHLLSCLRTMATYFPIEHPFVRERKIAKAQVY